MSFFYRIKFQDSSSSSESELDHQSVLYYDDDRQLPIISQMEHGYPVHLLIHTLLSPAVDGGRICKVQPLGVSKNAVFHIDLDVVPFEDLKADDLGSWAATGTKRTHFRFTKTNAIKYATGIPSSADYFRLRGMLTPPPLNTHASKAEVRNFACNFQSSGVL